MAYSFSIVSYVGAEPLLFGMAEDQVEKLVGSPLQISVNNLGEKNAEYESFSVRYSKTSQTLVEIGCSPPARATLDNIDLFSSDDVLQRLILRNPQPYEYFGFIIFLDLGITVTGFHDGDIAQRAVTVFARGRWDHLLPKFKKFRAS